MDNSDYSESENEVDEAQHSSLLDAVSQLDNKQRVKPPVRKESSHQVSEFHLTKSDSFRKNVHLTNLTKALNQRAHFAEVGKKLRSFQRKPKTLPPPLEKPAAARIQRSVGFEKVKKQLNRWNAVVEANRVSDQLRFPLSQSNICFETTDDFVEKLKSQPRTPLEAAMDEILNNSPAAQEDLKAEMEYKLTLAELRERRKELAKLRAQESYMAAKAKRQNKIKSKKYHRVLRRERIRQQLKEFEMLQKVDPEAALKQLEQLERTRAEERVSLRHRNTGQWARNKAVRAKYDQATRQELAQQLAVSRDLTQKMKTNASSDEENDEDDKAAAPGSSENPWIGVKTSSEVEDFVSGYHKFWEEQNKKLGEQISAAKQKNDQETEENIDNSAKSQLESNKSSENGVVALDEDASVRFQENTSVKTSGEESKVSPEKRKRIRNKRKKKNSNLCSGTESSSSAVVATTRAWQVTAAEEAKPDVQIDKLFRNMERNLKKKVKTKLKRVRDLLDNEKTETSSTEIHSDDEGPSLKMKKPVTRADLDENLLEGSRSNVESSGLNLSDLVARSRLNGEDRQPVSDNIDPNRFIAMKPKHLLTDIPDIVTEGDEGVDDNEEADGGAEDRQKAITEAFADDDVVADFRKEKEEAVEKSKPSDIDLTLPGWGEWGGKNLKISSRKKRRFIVRAPKEAPRNDANKEMVIINEEKNNKVKVHQVNELPFPFTSVKEFEASIRAPVGSTWVPETAHQKLTKPKVVTRLGAVITPMDEDMLVNKKAILQGFP